MYAMRLDPPPPLRRVVEYADLLRTATLAQLPPGADVPMLAGRSRSGATVGQHQHVHWLPWTTDAATLGGIVAWCPGGFGRVELDALRSLRSLRSMRVTAAVAPTQVRLPEGAEWWASLTPYVPAWHDEPVSDDVARECGHRGLPAPQVWTLPSDGQRWRTLRPSRRYERMPPKPVRVAVRFPQPVAAPVALGRLAHFGLGMFWPVDPAVLRDRWGVPA